MVARASNTTQAARVANSARTRCSNPCAASPAGSATPSDCAKLTSMRCKTPACGSYGPQKTASSARPTSTEGKVSTSKLPSASSSSSTSNQAKRHCGCCAASASKAGWYSLQTLHQLAHKHTTNQGDSTDSAIVFTLTPSQKLCLYHRQPPSAADRPLFRRLIDTYRAIF